MRSTPYQIVEADISGLAFLIKTIRDPVSTLPPACREADMVVARNFGYERVYLSHPELLHEALVGKADAMAKSAEMKRVLEPALGQGLLTADGPMWRWQRQAMASTFRPERINALLPAMIAAAKTTRDEWLARPPGSIVDVGPAMMHTTFAIILATMLSGSRGIDVARVERAMVGFLAATSWMFALAFLDAPHWVPFPGRRRALEAARFMRATIRSRINERRLAARQASVEDLIDLLLAAADPETGQALDDEQITDNLITFIAAGHETTAIALTWTLALLAAHPACLARLQAEIDDVTGGGEVRPEHIADLAYARQVFSEAMRLYPPAPIIARSTEKDISIGGQPVAAGSVVLAPIHALHRHRKLWERPDAFDPDRFAPDAVRARHRFAYMPFGAGPRICIGNGFAMLEGVAILAVLVQAIRFESVVADLPPAIARITLRPRHPIRLRVARREVRAS